jgi:hypothetical protein
MEEKAGELASFFEAMDINHLKRPDFAEPMKAIIADLWRTTAFPIKIDSRRFSFSCLFTL